MGINFEILHIQLINPAYRQLLNADIWTVLKSIIIHNSINGETMNNVKSSVLYVDCFYFIAVQLSIMIHIQL